MSTFTNEQQEIRVKKLKMKIADLEKENLRLDDERRFAVAEINNKRRDISKLEAEINKLRTTLKLSTEKEEGRFYCNWCGEMKPIEERREITDETEYVTWLGCGDCYKKKVRLDNVTE